MFFLGGVEKILKTNKHWKGYITIDSQKCAVFPNVHILSSLTAEIICLILFIYPADGQIKVSSFSHFDPWFKGRVNPFWWINCASNHFGE